MNSIAASPETIEPGQSSTLSWSSADASGCIGSGFDTAGAAFGQAVVAPAESTVYEIDCNGALDSATVTVNRILPSGQQPFAANLVPGYVEAEDYDLGGEGVAYQDTDVGNNGGEYRADDVDIKPNTYDGGYTVGWGDTGEWMEWTLAVREAGDYLISAYAGANDRATSPMFTLSIDGAPLPSTPVPQTGSWDVKQYVEVGTVSLTAGSHLMRVDINQRWVDIDHFEFTTPTHPLPDDVTPPSVVIAEPPEGARVSRSRNTLVRVNASDDESGVDTVALRIEGALVATFSGPGGHEYSWRPAGRGGRQVVIEATAVDLAGNESSHRITVQVRRQ